MKDVPNLTVKGGAIGVCCFRVDVSLHIMCMPDRINQTNSRHRERNFRQQKRPSLNFWRSLTVF